MTYSQRSHIETVVQRIQARIEARPAHAYLDQETVEALDVVNHALHFVKHPRGLELWRAALWRKQVNEDVLQALTEMLTYLLDEVAKGNFEAVTKICDCLQPLVSSTLAAEELHAGA